MIKDVLLNNGVKMPQEGFGVFQITDLAQCTQVVLDAIETGYRLFDTAAYNNEAAVGEAIRQSGLKREEFFITTKIDMDSIGEEKARAGFERQLKLLGLDYLDLYLVHMPWGKSFSAGTSSAAWQSSPRPSARNVCRRTSPFGTLSWMRTTCKPLPYSTWGIRRCCAPTTRRKCSAFTSSAKTLESGRIS